MKERDDMDFPDWFTRFHDVNTTFDPDYSNLAEYGYHFRLPGGTRAFVGRTAWEHDMLRRSAHGDDLLLQPSGRDNPVVLCRDISWTNDILIAAGILASFNLHGALDVEIAPASGQGNAHILRDIQPVGIRLLEKWKVESSGQYHETISTAGGE